MRLSAFAFALLLLPACSSSSGPAETNLSPEDEFAFRQLREAFHLAYTTGDDDLMRSLWADDAVLTTKDDEEFVGGENIADFISSDPTFGALLVLTVESSWSVVVRGNTADFAFESISVDVGANDPTTTVLTSGDAQNPDVEIVSHTNSTGVASLLGDGRWIFQELNSGFGPLPPAQRTAAGSGGLAPIPSAGSTPPEDGSVSLEDELGFRRMRENFHLANLIGDVDLMRTVWAEDAVFRGGPNEFFGVDAIVEFFANGAAFGKRLVVTPESSQTIVVKGDTIEYGFECIAIDVGDNDPTTIDLCTPEGTQNPGVEIVFHSHSTGTATRLADGRWVFQEFNGGPGPLPAEE